MNCPFCNHYDSKVVDSRPTEEGQAIRRRRECMACSKRFTTYEKIEQIPLMVVKKSGNREAFNSNKVMNGILKACEKRPVSLNDIEKIVDDVEKEVYNSMEKEITTELIGELIIERIKRLDEVAYVRFASVYREFKDINTFIGELKKLLDEKGN
ncbi:transcriptional regulator NrdR [Serpentinicella alkaliphila]|uniref:Transcriptional repressor NrdR n=1 Tax=Serpentinicella alkaliphila TaxID=1734049 RepID=A0A4R2TVB2_9FIRM|nr:transcriptional regulator NrdR [Serpentinicella alkaliphila]QUH26079.1 transcriptional repressor NrdR [Serpentinicella alkaliphila]TCP99092.1 transcriptional repressor NrdR [Serpentinicella alkaliphila]